MNEVTRHWLVSTSGGNHQPRSQGPLLLGPRVGEDPGRLGTRLGNHLGEQNQYNPQYSEKGHHIHTVTSRTSPSVIPIFQDVKDCGFHECLRVSKSRSDSVSKRD